MSKYTLFYLTKLLGKEMHEVMEDIDNDNIIILYSEKRHVNNNISISLRVRDYIMYDALDNFKNAGFELVYNYLNDSRVFLFRQKIDEGLGFINIFLDYL